MRDRAGRRVNGRAGGGALASSKHRCPQACADLRHAGNSRRVGLADGVTRRARCSVDVGGELLRCRLHAAVWRPLPQRAPGRGLRLLASAGPPTGDRTYRGTPHPRRTLHRARARRGMRGRALHRSARAHRRHRRRAEPAGAMLVHRRAVAPRASFVVGRAERLPFVTASFDLVTAAGALNYTDRDRSLAEIARVLAPAGVLAIYDFSSGRRSRHAASLGAWFDEFERRYPFPPGYAMDVQALEYGRVGLQLAAYEPFEVAIALDLRGVSRVRADRSERGARDRVRRARGRHHELVPRVARAGVRVAEPPGALHWVHRVRNRTASRSGFHMPDRTLTRRALNRATLARQMLLAREAVKPVTAVERLAGLAGPGAASAVCRPVVAARRVSSARISRVRSSGSRSCGAR